MPNNMELSRHAAMGLDSIRRMHKTWVSALRALGFVSYRLDDRLHVECREDSMAFRSTVNGEVTSIQYLFNIFSFNRAVRR